MSFVNMRIGVRLGLGFGLVLLLLAGVLAISISSMAGMGKQMDNIVNNHSRKVAIVGQMVNDFRYISTINSLVVIIQDEAGLQQQKAELAAVREHYGKSKQALTSLDLDEQEKQLLAKLEEKLAAAKGATDRLYALREQRDFPAAADWLVKHSVPATSLSIGVLEEIVAYEIAQAEQAGVRAESAYDSTRTYTLGLGALAMLLGGLVAWLITRSITRPINDAVKVAETVSAGDLTSRINVVGKDETGRLLHALRNMNESLVTIVTEVRSGSEAIATASSQIAAGNHDLSARTEQQAANITQTAAAMEELSSAVRNSADVAQQASQLANTASKTAGKGGEIVTNVVATMDGINSASKKIVDIISVIDSIAFQTNILALNAAVEAARAGEEGRGFAVVAAEVRSLAQKSASAAKDIKLLIDDTVLKVDEGTKMVDIAGETMLDIVTQVKRVSDLIGEISAATNEQTSGLVQINEAVVQLSDVTQQNAALVEESAVASESLNDQVTHLVTVTGAFKLSHDQGQAAAPRVRAAASSLLAAPARVARGLKSPDSVALRQPMALAKAQDEWESF